MQCNKDTKWGHNYYAGICIDCNRLQETITHTVYDKIKKERNLTEDQQLAEEIWLWFGKSKEVKFGMLMGMIRQKGKQWIRQCWREVVVDKAKNPEKVFKWKVAQVKMLRSLCTDNSLDIQNNKE